jgi:type III secretory pathway component EscV
MENENRIAELLAEALLRLDKMVLGQQESNLRLDRMERELTKLNMQTAENTTAIIKLADKFDQITELDKRVKELEKVVFK